MSKRPIPKLSKPRKFAGDFAESPGLSAAKEAASAPRRKPDEADAPPVSTFPSTPASREALRLSIAGPV